LEEDFAQLRSKAENEKALQNALYSEVMKLREANWALYNQLECALAAADSHKQEADSLRAELESIHAYLDKSAPKERTESEDDLRERARSIRFILDRYKVSDGAYHELSMLFDFLPRSYKIKDVRQGLNKEMDELLDMQSNSKGNGKSVDVRKVLANDAQRLLSPHANGQPRDGTAALLVIGDDETGWRSETPLVVKLAV
jgi:hypothetical protein